MFFCAAQQQREFMNLKKLKQAEAAFLQVTLRDLKTLKSG